MNSKDTAVRRLVCTMTLQAIADYVRAHDYISTHDIEEYEPEVKSALGRMHEIDYFFLSEWFEFLNPIPRISGTEILALLHSGALDSRDGYIFYNEGVRPHVD